MEFIFWLTFLRIDLVLSLTLSSLDQPQRR